MEREFRWWTWGPLVLVWDRMYRFPLRFERLWSCLRCGALCEQHTRDDHDDVIHGGS